MTASSLTQISCALLLAWAGGFALAGPVHGAERPNIIYILADDLGYGDLGAFGQEKIKTPHLDRMAAEGMKFTRHYAGSTVCAPSRCVLMTGLHTGHCRVRGNDAWTIPDSDVTVPGLLKQAGYATACFGKYGLGKPLPEDDPNKKGFDVFYGYVDTSHAHNFYPTYLVRNGEREMLGNTTIPGSQKAGHPDTGVAAPEGRKQWAPALIGGELQKYLESRVEGDAPFFVYYALNLPHANNEAGKDSPLGHGMETPDYGEFATRDWPEVEKGFASAIRFIDDEVGAILATLKRKGIDENTLVIFTSDNGPHSEGLHRAEFFNSSGKFAGIKRALTDGGIRVPMIARWPGKVAAGSESRHVSGFQDVLPTVAALAGAPKPAGMDGISFVPSLLGKGEQRQHLYLFWDFNEQGGKRAVLQWPWKLIHLNTGRQMPASSPKAKAKAKEQTQTKKKGAGPRALQVQLFNLETDVGEATNLAKDQPEIVARLEGFMKEAWTEPVR
jgi:arylsulfatase A-like enzyme